MDIPMPDDNSNGSYRYKNYRNRNRRHSDHQPYRNDYHQRNSNETYQGNSPANNNFQHGPPFQMGQQGPAYSEPCYREGMQQNFPQFGNLPPGGPMFHQQGYQMQNFPHGPGHGPGFSIPPQDQIGPAPGGYFGMPPSYREHPPPFERGAQNYQNEQDVRNYQNNQQDRNMTNMEGGRSSNPYDEARPQMPNDKLNISKLGGFLNFTEYSTSEEDESKNCDENQEKGITGDDENKEDCKITIERSIDQDEDMEEDKSTVEKNTLNQSKMPMTSNGNKKLFNPNAHMPPLPPLPPPFKESPMVTPPKFQHIRSPLVTPPSFGLIKESSNSSYYTPKLENIPTPTQPYPSPHAIITHPPQPYSPHPNMPHPSLARSSNTLQSTPLAHSHPINHRMNPMHTYESKLTNSGVLNHDQPPLPPSSKDILFPEKSHTSSPLPAKIEVPLPSSTARVDVEDKYEVPEIIQPQSSEKLQVADISESKEVVKPVMKDNTCSMEKGKPDMNADRLSLAMKKQQIDVIPSSVAGNDLAKKQEQEKAMDKFNTPLKKRNMPLLGKEAAKKMLKSFSTNKALLKEKSKVEEGDEKAKLSVVDVIDDEKKEVILKKKKKSEKVSFIEQIKEEETRIKEVLSHTSNIFSSYGIGLGMPEINNFFDNPEALRKFEARGKDFVQKIEKGELVSPIQLTSSGSSATKEKERSSRSSSHYNKESSRVKSKESSSKKGKVDEGRRSSKASESETSTKHKVKEIPTSWEEMKKRNMKVIDLWRIIDNARRKSRSSSPIKDKKNEINKNLPFPDLPKRFHQFKASNAVKDGGKCYPGSLVQYTNTKPSIPYCVDSKKYKSHYWTRRELKGRNRNNSGIMKIIEKFWNLEPNFKQKSFPSQRNWWSDNYLEEMLNDETDEDEEEEDKDQEDKEEEKERTESALDYLSSSYKLSDVFDKDEDNNENLTPLESLSPTEKEEEEDVDDDNDDESEMEISKSEYSMSQEVSNQRNSADIKLTTQELNEEYEAFINTLEYKPDESCSTTGLSEDNLDLNVSLMSFDDIQVTGDTKGTSKKSKAKKKSFLPYQPKSVKEIKQLLLEAKLSKRQRKELKRLKKKMKNEKKEIKKLKKEMKKKKKEENKLKKKQAKKKEKIEHISVISKRNISKDIEESKNYVKDPYVVDEWEEEYNIEATSSESVEDVLKKEEVSDDTSGFHELSKSSDSPVASSSASNLSCFKSFDEKESASEGHVEGTQDRYSPSNMSVCSPESPEASSSSDLYLSYDKTEEATEYPPSPYSPSSPQSSISDATEYDPIKSVTSLDAIPLPSMQSVSLTQTSTKTSSATTFVPVENISMESSFKLTTPSDNNISQDSEYDTTLEAPVKKTPVVFKLGSKKPSGGLKLLQKAPLPGFAENEEEDERSPMFDLHEASNKLDKVKSSLVGNILPSKLDSGTDSKEKTSDPDNEQKNELNDEIIAKKEHSSKDSSIDSEKEIEKASKRSYTSTREEEMTNTGKESSTSKSSTSDSQSSKRLKESESKRGKDHSSGSSKNRSSSTSEKHRDKRSPSPKRRKERKREDSPESRRKRHSRSPEGSRRSYHKIEHDNSSYRSRSKTPPNRYSERYRSPERFGDKGRDSHRDSRSQSPSPKWKRIKSPPPKRYKESSDRSRGQDDRRRYYREDGRSSRSSYSPRNRSRSSSQLDSPESISRARSPGFDFKNSSDEKYSSYSPRPIDSISNQILSSAPDHWDWADSSKSFYSTDDRQISSEDSKERSSSPSKSPKRLSLDERLKQEHGVEVAEDQLNQGDYPRQGYYWEYEPPPMVGTPQVVRIGNVLQIFPLPDNPTEQTPVPPQEDHSYVGIPVPPPVIPPTGIPILGIPPPEMPSVVSKIVQSGNVIEVVPTDTLMSSSDLSKADVHCDGQQASVVPSASITVTSTSSSVLTSSDIAPVPPPSTTPSNPLAFISSLLASSMSKPAVTHSSTTAPSSMPVSSIALFSESTQNASSTRTEEAVKPVESCIPGLDTQQQQAIISAAVAAAASGVTASNLPIAHLISVLQQQSLLSQPSVTSDTQSTPHVNESQLQVDTQSAPELPKIDLDAFRREIKERKKQKRKEKELRREAKRQKAIIKKLEQQQKMEQKMEELKADDPYDEDDAVLKEAMTEVPELGSPMPDYEVYNDDDLDEDEEEEKKPVQPLPLPPEKGILIGPTYRIIRNKERKAVSFADGVMPGYGTSPSGGEEIHSPPPQIFPEKEKKKKLRKKKKVKVRIIKQYVLGDTRMDSPPPPPETPPTAGTLKLYPGCTHYTLTAPGTFVIYTQQPLKVNGSSLGLAVGNAVTIPPGMLIHSSALSKRYAAAEGVVGITSIPPSMPSSFPLFLGEDKLPSMGVQDLQSPTLN